ncbi:uncharacterized protein [Atheta coriaria]|uniref:uncharacterized protein isoform X1 n=1 Tax=Dalotia coriaria TaxID=877792 RepID=UPI0031F3845E
MQSSTTNLHPVTKRNKFINLLNSYVPTNERSWNYAIPIFGLSLSCFAFGMFLTFIENVSRRPIVNTNMYNFGYLVLAIAAGIELYYGMTHRSRRQYSFWIFLKIIEVFLLTAGIVMEIIPKLYRTQIGLLSGGVIILFLDILLLCYVIKRSTRPQRKTIENIYEVPHAHQYCNVSVY